MFVHTVLFYLNPDLPPSAPGKLISDIRECLAPIPAVRTLHVGLPANTPRKVVDNTYAVGLTVILDDPAAHDAYQAHPLHTEFKQRIENVVESVKIYDCIDA